METTKTCSPYPGNLNLTHTHFGVGEFTHVFKVGIESDVHWGYGILDFDPYPDPRRGGFLLGVRIAELGRVDQSKLQPRSQGKTVPGARCVARLPAG